MSVYSDGSDSLLGRTGPIANAPSRLSRADAASGFDLVSAASLTRKTERRGNHKVGRHRPTVRCRATTDEGPVSIKDFMSWKLFENGCQETGGKCCRSYTCIHECVHAGSCLARVQKKSLPCRKLRKEQDVWFWTVVGGNNGGIFCIWGSVAGDLLGGLVSSLVRLGNCFSARQRDTKIHETCTSIRDHPSGFWVITKIPTTNVTTP